jgi:hypothetical protein
MLAINAIKAHQITTDVKKTFAGLLEIQNGLTKSPMNDLEYRLEEILGILCRINSRMEALLEWTRIELEGGKHADDKI